eukprot:6191954-Pleurochrysis_carterae.AAC.1
MITRAIGGRRFEGRSRLRCQTTPSRSEAEGILRVPPLPELRRQVPLLLKDQALPVIAYKRALASVAIENFNV